jgi:hypothetical protein
VKQLAPWSVRWWQERREARETARLRENARLILAFWGFPGSEIVTMPDSELFEIADILNHRSLMMLSKIASSFPTAAEAASAISRLGGDGLSTKKAKRPPFTI